MAPRQSQSNADKLNDIAERLVVKYLSAKCSGIINPDHFDFRSAKKHIQRFSDKIDNSEDAVLYHSAMGILYAAQGKLVQAKIEYEKVIKLVSKFGEHFSNYNTILIGVSEFQIAKRDLEEYFSTNGKDFEMLLNLFYCCRWDLDFSSFNKYYESIRGKDVLSHIPKNFLEYNYQSIKQFERLKEDLPSIDISMSLYSEFYSLLNAFHDEHLYNALKVTFEIDDDEDQCLVIYVYADISDVEALMLTSKFEKYMVNYAITNGKRQLLSKFLVFFIDKEFFQENERPDIYLRSDSLVI